MYKEQIRNVIKEIDASLEDIQNNEYGICANCNKNIKKGRLELILYAKTCLKCSGDNNSEDSRNDDKVYESVNYKNFELKNNEKKKI